MAIDTTLYWTEPPPIASPNVARWMARIAAGWRPNKRISSMGYSERARFFGVYVWEYLNVIYPALVESRR